MSRDHDEDDHEDDDEDEEDPAGSNLVVTIDRIADFDSETRPITKG